MIGKVVSHYRILEQLGGGGMGIVYKAQDLKLDRLVALKFLAPELTRDPEAKTRFIHEARAASALQHTNICVVHDIDETDDSQMFIAMEYLDGEMLKTKIERTRLSIEEAVDIALQVARGLAKAHEGGIVHRDIKPANVILTSDGVAKIVDFGLAKLSGQTMLTKVGSTLGTVAYMSPEQARGGESDQRTDIWSLGVVLYEMLTGVRPFKSEYEQALIFLILNEEPTSPQSLRVEIPTDLARIIMKSVTKNPAERFRSAGELAAELHAVSRRLQRGNDGMSTDTAKAFPSIAVMPFVNMSPDPENEYFSDGLAEDIIDALTQVPGLRVMARTSAFAFRGKEMDVREIGARLGVEHILEGSVRRAGNRLRVTAQLVKASDGYHLWSQRFDREMTDIFAIQDEISRSIVEKLGPQLAANRPIIKRPTENMAAYELCLKARYHAQQFTQEGIEAARRHSEQAIVLDPGYAGAHYALGFAAFLSAYFGYARPLDALKKAKSAALEALRLDDTLAEAHGLLGATLSVGEYNWDAAEQEVRRGLELNPMSAWVRYWRSQWLLLPQGLLEEASTEIQVARDLDPLDAMFNTYVGYTLHLKRRFEEAVAQYHHVIDLDPTFWNSYWGLSATFALLDRGEEAIAMAEKAKEFSRGNSIALGALGRAFGLAGRMAEARQLLEQLEERSLSSYVPPIAMAMIYRGLGDFAKTLEWFVRGIDEHDPALVMFLKNEPSYDPLRQHPVYHTLLRKMNLVP